MEYAHGPWQLKPADKSLIRIRGFADSRDGGNFRTRYNPDIAVLGGNGSKLISTIHMNGFKTA